MRRDQDPNLHPGDPLDVPDLRAAFEDSHLPAIVQEIIDLAAERLCADGTKLADERESLIWGLVNCFHAQTQRIDRALDRMIPELRDLERAQDGSEVPARELELMTDRAHNMGDRRDALEIFRDCAAEAYRARTGEVWRPRTGSHASRTGNLTSAAIDARDFQRARQDRKNTAHLPQGTLVAIAGGKDVADAAATSASTTGPVRVGTPVPDSDPASRHSSAVAAPSRRLPRRRFTHRECCPIRLCLYGGAAVSSHRTQPAASPAMQGQACPPVPLRGRERT